MTTDELTTEQILGGVIAKAVKAATAPLREQIVRLEDKVRALESRPVMKDAGVWKPGVQYDAGAIVTFNGCGWICRASHVSGDKINHDHFRLFVKGARPVR